MWREYADAFVGADVVVITDIYSSGTTPIPGVTGRLVVNAVLDAHPTARVVWLPRRDDMVSFLAGEVGSATCASRWAAATSPRCPTRCCAPRPPEVAVMATVVDLAGAVAVAAEILGPAAALDEPLGPLTTYRVGGPAAIPAGARRDHSRRWLAARAASGPPVLVVGRGSNLLVADEGFAGIAVSVTDLAVVELPAGDDPPIAPPAAASRGRCWRGRRRRPAGAASSGRSASRLYRRRRPMNAAATARTSPLPGRRGAVRPVRGGTVASTSPPAAAWPRFRGSDVTDCRSSSRPAAPVARRRRGRRGAPVEYLRDRRVLLPPDLVDPALHAHANLRIVLVVAADQLRAESAARAR